MVNDVTSRFIIAYNSLVDSGQISDKKDFADKIGVSPSMITEISKGRSNVGTLAVQNIVLVFKVSSDWLLTGNGPMLKNDHQTEVMYDSSAQYEKKKDDEILFLKEIITNQQKELNNKQKIIDSQLDIINAYRAGKIVNVSSDADNTVAKKGVG